jgi:ketosteroid isomerase-like protein
MEREFICYFMLSLFAVGLIACGDSDEAGKEQPKTTTPQTPQTGGEPTVEGPRVEVDLAAEQAAIQALLDSHAIAQEKRDVGDIMGHWLKSETSDVFIVESFGAETCTERWSGVKKMFEGWFRQNRPQGIPRTIEEIGLDARGQNATLRGKKEGAAKYTGAVRKDRSGRWKIRAINYLARDNKVPCKIKWIEMP